MANLNLTLKVWRQENAQAQGRIETYKAKNIPDEASFLEMLDIVNEELVHEGKEPIVFDHDCRRLYSAVIQPRGWHIKTETIRLSNFGSSKSHKMASL